MSRGSRRGGAFIALPATLLLLVSSLAGATPVRQGAQLAPESAPQLVSMVIETTSPEAVAELVIAAGGQVTWRFENLDALSVSLPADRIGDVLADSRVGEVAPAREVRRAVVTPDFPRLLSGDGFRRSRPVEHDGTTFPAPDADRWSVRPLPVSEILGPARGGAPESFGFHPAIGAQEVWEQTGAGEGIIVAIIDTGVHAAHPLLEGNTIGGFNLVPAEEEMAIDLDGNGEGDGRHYDWDSVHNNSHGTFVGGIIAGHAELELPADDAFAVSVQTNQPNAITFEDDVAKLNLLGVAPGASLYGVKVFPYNGGSAPDARVAEAIDRLISMKRRGELDTHVINLSLSGPVLFDGLNPLDRMIDRATFYGITCVCAASNDGPALVSVGSPGSALTALTVGGAMDAIRTRTAVEVLFGAPPGAGQAFYPYEFKMADFASRGLTADGRVKPDLMATAFFAFSSNTIDITGDGVADVPSFGFGSGTSFSCPAVAGAAALCTAVGRQRGHFGRAPFVATALMKSANPIEGEFSQRDQGRGYVNVAGAAELIAQGRVWWPGRPDADHEMSRRVSLHSGSADGSTPDLEAAESFDYFVTIPENLESIEIRFPSVTIGNVQNPLFGDAVFATVHSAKRGGSADYVFADSIEPGDAFTWYYPEPGTARITVSAQPSNYSPVSASFTAEATRLRSDADWTFRGTLRRDETVAHTVDVPAGLDAMGVRLRWKHDWTRFPTYDLDLFLRSPSGAILPVASIDSPELGFVEDPEPGEWTFVITDYSTVLHRERYQLEVAALEIERRPTEAIADFARPRILSTTPNPSRAATEVAFAVPARGPVEVQVYDVTGRLVRTLARDSFEAGDHRLRWDGRGDRGEETAAGVYFVKLRTEQGSSTQKLVRLQ